MATVDDLLAPTQPSGQGGTTVDDILGTTPPAAVGGLRPKQNSGVIGDLGTSLKRGVEEIPGMLTGLADVINPVTYAAGIRPANTAANWLGEKTGFQPGKWAEEAKQEYSPEMQQAQQDVGTAWQGVKDTYNDPNKTAGDVAAQVGKTAEEYLSHPSLIANQLAESIPSMALGGAVGRGLNIAGRIAPAVEGAVAPAVEQGLGWLGRTFGEKTGAAIAGGAGQGVVQAGQSMDQYQGNDVRKGALAALGSGLTSAAIAAGAGRLAEAAGLDTHTTAMAKGFNKAVTDELEQGPTTTLGKVGQGLRGGAVEGILQGLPQGVQAQVFQNYANDKPLWEGVPQAAVESAVSFFALGAGANMLPKAKPSDARIDQVQQQTLQNLAPDMDISVNSGTATVTHQTADGSQTFTAPVADIAKHLTTGKGLDEFPQKDLKTPGSPTYDVIEQARKQLKENPPTDPEELATLQRRAAIAPEEAPPSEGPLFSKTAPIPEGAPDTPEFRKFYGNSAVDKVVYHGSETFGKGEDAASYIFRESNTKDANTKSPGAGLGHFFAENESESRGYAGLEGKIFPMYLRIEKPYETNSYELPAFKNRGEAKKFQLELKKQGYDGIHLADEEHWVPFDANQMKSVDNSGTFSRENPDVRFSKTEAPKWDEAVSKKGEKLFASEDEFKKDYADKAFKDINESEEEYLLRAQCGGA